MVNNFSSDNFKKFQKVVEEVSQSEAAKGGRKFFYFGKENPTVASNKQEDSNALLKFVESLQNLKVDETGLELFESTFLQFERMVSKDYPDSYKKTKKQFQKVYQHVKELEKIEAIQKSTLFKVSVDPDDLEPALKQGKEMGLSEYDAMGVFLYTTELYRIVNAVLRNQEDVIAKEYETWDTTYNLEIGEEEFVEECKLFADAIISGLKNLPSTKGTIYRGDLADDDEIEQMKNGIYQNSGFLSFSSDRDEAIVWLDRKPTNDREKHPVLITVEDCHEGKNIAELSQSPDEEETLYLPKKKFKVEEQGEIVENDVKARSFKFTEI